MRWLLGLAGLGACVAPAEPPREPLPIPFVVSDHYSPDGFFGDGELLGHLELTRGCPDRAPGARGDCVTITHRPGPRGFAGVFWQHPHNNWGVRPGHRIEPGATRIEFRARGATGNASINVGAGLTGAALPMPDRFQIEERQIALTPQWQAEELPFFGVNYQGDAGVVGAFVVSFQAAADGGVTQFFLDDIRWVK